MQSLRHAHSFCHALAAHRSRPVGFRAVKHNTNSFPGKYSSKHAHALLGQGVVSLLLRVVSAGSATAAGVSKNRRLTCTCVNSEMTTSTQRMLL